MTVMAHPSKSEIKRYRLWDKELNLQEFFGPRKYGSLDAAYEAALKRQAAVDKRKHASKLKRQLSINILFHEDGRVKGLRKRKRVRDDRQEDEHFFDYIVIVRPKVQEHGYVSLNKYDFDTAWTLITDKLLKTLDIESTLEIRQQFKKSKRLYW